MKLNLVNRLLVVLIGAAGLVGLARAATIDAGTLTPTALDNTTSFAAADYPTPYTFQDVYNFTIGDFQTLMASAASSTLPGTNAEQSHVSNLSFSLFASADGSPLGSVSAGSANQVDFSQTLVAGDYFLKVSGVTDGSLGGAYQVSIAAVPEPGEWMMLLAGVAVVGFMARRKSAGVMAG